MKIIITIILQIQLEIRFCPVFVLSQKQKTRAKFSTRYWSGTDKYFCFQFALPQSQAEFNRLFSYKGIFLHVIPAHIRVPCFEVTLKEIKNIKSEVNELKKSIKFTEKVLEEKGQNIGRKVSSLEEKVEEIYDYQIDTDEAEKKLTKLQDLSKRNNLQIGGFAEENGESWDNCERKAKNIFYGFEFGTNIII